MPRIVGMRRWFITLLTLLVAAQLSWAGAALCCLGELGGAPSPLASIVAEPAHAVPAAEAHPVCETAGHCHCHHAGFATGADEVAPCASLPPAPEALAAAPLKSHIPAGLDRPSWLRA